jgi:hypothetical protein
MDSARTIFVGKVLVLLVLKTNPYFINQIDPDFVLSVNYLGTPIKLCLCVLRPGWPNDFAKRIAQNEAQFLFRSKLTHNFFTVEKIVQKCGLLL